MYSVCSTPGLAFPQISRKEEPRGKPSQDYHLGPSLAWDVPHLPVFERCRDQARDGLELESTPIPGAQPDLDSQEGMEIVEVRHTRLESSLGLSPVASAILSKNLLLAADHGRPLLFIYACTLYPGTFKAFHSQIR